MSTNYEALERAVNYIEQHLTSKLSVDEVAFASYYSAPHLSWMFKDVTGIGVGEYIRLRRISEAAKRIMAGGDIQAAALAYGFSSQQVLTRCIGSQFGVTPATLRRRPQNLGRLVPRIAIGRGVETMKLVADYDWKNGEHVDELMEKILTKDAMSVIERAAAGPVPSAEISTDVRNNLLYIGALREDAGELHIGVPVITAEDRARMQEGAKVLAVSLADRIAESADRTMLREHPRVHDDEDLARYSHFLTGPVTLGWQGHEMLLRLGRIPSRAENTDEKGRWYLLRFYELAEQHYQLQTIGTGGSMWGHHWSLSTTCATREQNILEHLAGIRNGVSEDQIELRDEALAAIIDSISECVASDERRAPQFGGLAARLGLMRHGKPVAVVLKASEFEIPKRFIDSVYGAMVSWWQENEQQVDEILAETTAGRLGIEHRHLYHQALLTITGEAGVHLVEKGYLVDFGKLESGAVNAVWELATNLQGNVLGVPNTDAG